MAMSRPHISMARKKKEDRRCGRLARVRDFGRWVPAGWLANDMRKNTSARWHVHAAIGA
jgi:hypothetical protein